MQRIQDPTAVTSMPAAPILTGQPVGFFQGSIAGGIVTRIRYWWLNMIQEELIGLLVAAGQPTDGSATVAQSVKLLRGFTVTPRSFPSSVLYTPPARLIAAFVEVQAPGGGGGACPNSSGGLGGAGGGGGGGGYISGWFTPTVIGASQVITIGAPGFAGLVGANPTAGGATAFGGYLDALGGQPGTNAPANGTGAAGNGGSFSSTAGPTIVKAKAGKHGAVGIQSTATNGSGTGGMGGDAELGFGGAQGFATDAPGGRAPDGQDYGGGGSGAGVSNVTVNGGNGAPGVVRITEYTWNL